jgi:hypothetical protein
MSHSSTPKKRLHSPARKFQFQEFPMTSFLSLKKLRSSKPKKYFPPKPLQSKSSTPTSLNSHQFFNPIPFKEKFLIDPSPSSRVLSTPLHPFSSNLVSSLSKSHVLATNYLTTTSTFLKKIVFPGFSNPNPASSHRKVVNFKSARLPKPLSVFPRR